MNPMSLAPFFPPPQWVPPQPLFPQPSAPPLPPLPPQSSSFWTSGNVLHCLKELNDTVNMAETMQKELEMLIMMQERKEFTEGENGCSGESIDRFSNFMKENKIDLKFQESMSLDAANAIMSKLRFQLEAFQVVTDEKSPWEEKSMVKRLADKMQKHKRNKLWRRRKRRLIAEMIAKEHENFDRMDKEADEWRAREIARDIANSKMEKMKEIAKVKEKEEKRRLASEFELVLIVEKLQELRSIRIQKLKKQGHFLPEEDDMFLEQVKAAVEEEERQAMAAADTDAAKDAIAMAEESRRTVKSHGLLDYNNPREDQKTESDKDSMEVTATESRESESEPGSSIANLPMEFYHYYHGSNADMGTLIEVRRAWDAYLRPGGSRIPGHWVQPPPPANEVWASYLVKPQ